MRCISLAAVILLAMLIPDRPAAAQHVTMRDGTIHEGAVTFTDGRIVVTPEGGDPIRLDLEQVEQAVFIEPLDDADNEDAAQPARRSRSQSRPVLAEYFADREMTQPLLVRMEAQIGFHLMRSLEERPDPLVESPFYVRWTSQIRPATEGEYQFTFVSDGGIRLWIDEQLVIDDWVDRRNPNNSLNGSIRLNEQQTYRIRVEYARSNQAWAMARLMWQQPGRGRSYMRAAQFQAAELPQSPPQVQINTPGDGASLIAPESVTIEITASDPDGEVKAIHLFEGETLLTSGEGARLKYEWKNPEPRYYVLTARALDDKAYVTDSAPVRLAISDGGPLPQPWGELKVGSSDQQTHIEWNEDRIVTNNADGDIWRQDTFQFIYRPFAGNAEIVTRLGSIDSRAPEWAVAGLMIRENLSASSPYAMLCLSPGGRASLLVRQSGGGEIVRIDQNGVATPTWLKLSRQENEVLAYLSTDGQDWMLLGSREVPMEHELFVGLATVRCKATYEQVNVGAGPKVQPTYSPGFVTVGGSGIAATINGIDEQTLRFTRPDGQTGTLPLAQVARLVYHPLSNEYARRIAPGETGALLHTRDFMQGTVRQVDRRWLHLDSLVFGIIRFELARSVVAVVLRDLPADLPPYEVREMGGSIYRVASIRGGGESIEIDDPVLGETVIPTKDLKSIRRVENGQER